MNRKALLALAAITMASPAVARADTTPVVVDTSADWTHQLTGMTFPVEAGGFSRNNIQDFGKQQLDLASTYFQQSSKTEATLYVYRAGLADASIWHDRIVNIIGQGRLGQADFSKAITTPFEAPGGNGGAIRTILPLQGRSITASGVAIFRHDDWLVAVRMSSETLDPASLDAQLTAYVNALRMPEPKHAATPAYSIGDCPDRLPDKRARRAETDIADALISGVQYIAAAKQNDDKGKQAPKVSPHYCRESAAPQFSVYRAGKPREGYVIALNDAGVALSVLPDTLGALLHYERADRFSVNLSTTDAQISYGSFNGLPTVRQVIEMLNEDRPISSTARAVGDNKNTTTTINAKP